MTIEEFLKKQNQERIKREERMARRLLAEYRRMDRALATVYTAFGREEEKGRQGDGETSGLAKRKQLKSLLDTVRAEIGKFGTQASAIIEQGQREEINGQRQAAGAILKLLGLEAPKIPPGGPENGPGMMGDGSKLLRYFNKKLASAVAARIRQAASNSAAAKSGAATLKKLKAGHGIILGRTLTAARAETMRLARETAHTIYQENGITEWTWHSQLSPTTCALCRSQHGNRHPIGEQLVSHPNCRCVQKPAKPAQMNRPAGGERLKSAPAGRPEEKKALSTFTGKLKGEDVRLKNVEIRRIRYLKRDPADTEALRKAFDSSKRKEFVKHITASAENIAILKQAGLSNKQIETLRSGKVPKGFQVHHKLPLDDGGDNSFSNLVLIKNDPFHKAITNEQNRLTKGLEPGKSKSFDWVMPPGIVYPSGK